MAKAINWPHRFREEVIVEDVEQERIGLRLGTLYYEHHYWVPDEVVDIRVEHKRIRKAVVIGDLRQCPISALSPTDFSRLKQDLQTADALIRFLSETYHQPVDAQTLVTVVTYRNLPFNPEEMEEQDDPHM